MKTKKKQETCMVLWPLPITEARIERFASDKLKCTELTLSVILHHLAHATHRQANPS